ncbi:DUF3099 domain-containing protein [Sinomonas sp. 5-5]|uniref:DUF3099 domain-containing protein n=2 Tax=Sinomonas terrae TaxID=2908838 RepID=A0ABS9U1J6_9MICC|nr:DUF3099 domain-containing protein [Sinomonas terrae]MCH6470456.1 DUF3099 domain-containing protein [Sinomonas terrae]
MKPLTDGTGDGPRDERSSEDPEVHSITTAAEAHSVDMHKRMVRYATAMGIRVVCIVALFFLDGWLKLVAVAGAVFLPWVAVVIANAQDKADTTSEGLLDAPPLAELEGGYGRVTEDGVVLTGEVVNGTDEDARTDDGGTAHEAPSAQDESVGKEEKNG